MKLMISVWICHSEGCLSFTLGNSGSLSHHCSNLTIRWPPCDLLLQKCIPRGNFRSFGFWEMTWGLQTISIVMDSPSLLPISFDPKQSHVFFTAYGYHVKKRDSLELLDKKKYFPCSESKLVLWSLSDDIFLLFSFV